MNTWEFQTERSANTKALAYECAFSLREKKNEPKWLQHRAQGLEVGDEFPEKGRRQTDHVDLSLGHEEKFRINAKYNESHSRIVSI